ncbi:30S ribosomal protein S2 [Salinibacter altiplanensis]|uniref:30S ribosomal protein S2 n=1 Tax=Salinibacter altiplanensis TaxID=1803181 RepID=UPI000C9ED43F|nr:30S ribosomal protein S2 [Salinibacter altiplanensis]
MADETTTETPDTRDEDAPEDPTPEAEDPTPEAHDDSPADSTDEAGPADDDEASAADTADAADQDSADADDASGEEEEEEETSHRVTIEALLKAGVHFGHLTSRWNPRMEKYIFMERNNIHIIDLMQTQVLLDEAAEAAKRFAQRGKKILFAGTKKQAEDIVREHAEECGMPHMVDRWLGGTMTNFQTIRKSIRRMEEIERMDRDGTLDKLKKKEKLMRLREHEKLEETLGGIRDMASLPGAIYIVDVQREDIAVSEANNLGIPTIAMVDTNGNPKNIDYPIPVNDDALSSIELVTSTLTDAVQEGLHERRMQKEEKKKAAA